MDNGSANIDLVILMVDRIGLGDIHLDLERTIL